MEKQTDVVKSVIDTEEAQFLRTLSRGEQLIKRIVNKIISDSSTNDKKLPGDIAWRLYDTYGFPIDLTTLICEESGVTVDSVGFEEAKKAAQVRCVYS